MDYALAMFVESTRSTTALSSRLKYSLDLSAIATRLGHSQLPLTRMYQGGLRASGALIPTEQATPITLEQLRHLQQQAPQQRQGDRLYTALFLLWKSASRWDEISRLSGNQVVRVSPEEIVLSWRDKTKASRSDPHRPDSQVAVRHLPAIPAIVIQTLTDLKPQEMLWPHTTEWFVKWVQAELPGSGLTAHSFKSAALTLITQGVIERNLPRELIPLIAKHKTATPALPATTLRYIRDEGLKADLLGTAQVTVLLPW